MKWFHHGLLAALMLLGCDVNRKAEPEPRVHTVERGELQELVLLTGVLDAAKSIELLVPRTESWNVALRWLAEDGAFVKEGERVIEFDNSAVLERLSELELAAIEADSELATLEADNEVKRSDKQFEVDTKKVEVAKAKLETEVPEELQSRREHRDAKLKLRRARADLASAKDDLKSTVEGGKIEEQVKRIAFDKAMRAYRVAKVQLEQRSLKAPRDGVFTVGMNLQDGRKLQVGDNVWPGMVAGELPDMSAMVVEATLSDVDDGRIQPGMRARCTVDAFPEQPLMGTVRAVSPIAHEPERNSPRRFFDVVVELDSIESDVLRPGLSVKVEVLARSAEDAVLVPRAAVDRSGETPTVRLEDGEEVGVEVDFCTAQTCVVILGIDVGARVSLEERR